MIGSNGPRMLSIALPHVDTWNTWYDDYGNTPEGFAELSAPASRDRSSAARACSSSSTGRSSACRGAAGLGRRPAGAHRALGEAGADEVILVASPINEESIRRWPANFCIEGASVDVIDRLSDSADHDQNAQFRADQARTAVEVRADRGAG